MAASDWGKKYSNPPVNNEESAPVNRWAKYANPEWGAKYGAPQEPQEPEPSTMSKVGSAVAYPFKKGLQALGFAQEKTTVPILKDAQEAVTGSFLESAQKSRELAKTTPKEETIRKLREARFSPLGDIMAPPEIAGAGEGMVGAAASTILMPTSLIDLAGMGIMGKSAKAIKAGEIAAIPKNLSKMEQFTEAMKAGTPFLESKKYHIAQAEKEIAEGINREENIKFLSEILKTSEKRAKANVRASIRADKARLAHEALTDAERLEKEALETKTTVAKLKAKKAEADALAAKTEAPDVTPQIEEATAPLKARSAKATQKVETAKLRLEELQKSNPEAYTYLERAAQGNLTRKPVGDISQVGSNEQLVNFIRSPKTSEEAAVLVKMGILEPKMGPATIIPKGGGPGIPTTTETWKLTKQGEKITREYSRNAQVLREATDEIAKTAEAMKAAETGIKAKYAGAGISEMSTKLREASKANSLKLEAEIAAAEAKLADASRVAMGNRQSAGVWEPIKDIASGDPVKVRLGQAELRKKYGLDTQSINKLAEEYREATKGLTVAQKANVATTGAKVAPMASQTPSVPAIAKPATPVMGPTRVPPTPTRPGTAQILTPEAQTDVNKIAALSQRIAGQAQKGTDRVTKISPVSDPTVVNLQKSLGDAYSKHQVHMSWRDMNNANYNEELVTSVKKAMDEFNQTPGVGGAYVAQTVDEVVDSLKGMVGASTHEIMGEMTSLTSKVGRMLRAGTEAGRSLGMFSFKKEKVTVELLKNLEEVSKKLIKSGYRLDDPFLQQLNFVRRQFAKKDVDPTLMNKLYGTYLSFLLSGPITHAKNIAGNAGMLAFMPIEKFAQAGVSQIFAKTSMSPAVRAEMGALARRNWDEGVAMSKELYKIAQQAGKITNQAAKNAIETFHNTGVHPKDFWREWVVKNKGLKFDELPFSTEDFARAGSKFDAPLVPIETKMLGSILNAPSKFLDVEDNVFKYLAARVKYSADKMRGLSRDELYKSLSEEAAYRTFQQSGDLTNAMMILKGIPGVRWFLPFVKTGTNIISAGLEKSPLGVAKYLYKRALHNRGVGLPYSSEERVKDLANFAIGNIGAGVLYSMYKNGKITGSYPAQDSTQRAIWDTEQRQPFSIKVNGKWTNLDKLEPFGTSIRAILGFFDGYSDKESEKTADKIAFDLANDFLPDWLGNVEKVAAKSVLGVAKGMRETVRSSPMYGISTMLDVVNDPEKTMGKLAKSYAASAVPSAVKFGADLMSGPERKETVSTKEMILNRIPMADSTLLPKLNLFGDPIDKRDAITGSTPAREYPELEFIKKAGVDISRFEKDLDGIPLDSQGQHKFKKLFGNIFKTKMGQVLGAVPMSALENEKVKDYAKKYIEKTISDTKAFLNYSMKGYEVMKYHKVTGNLRPEELVHIGDLASKDKGWKDKPISQRRLILQNYVDKRLKEAWDNGEIDKSMEKFVKLAKPVYPQMSKSVYESEDDIINDEDLTYQEKRNRLEEQFSGAGSTNTQQSVDFLLEQESDEELF